MTRVLIVDDDDRSAQSLAKMLRARGFEPTIIPDGSAALSSLDSIGTDIVLLGVLAPGIQGLHICGDLRSRGQVPIIMVTARDSEIDKIVGLEAGADDYVTKPYSVRELIARIDAVLRRRAVAARPPDVVLSAGAV